MKLIDRASEILSKTFHVESIKSRQVWSLAEATDERLKKIEDEIKELKKDVYRRSW